MRAQAEGAGDTYDSVSIAFHWITVFLVLALFVLALFPGIVKGSIALHKALGSTLFVIVLARIVWRLFKARPPRPEPGVPLLLRLGAKAAHVALYVLLLTVPALGYLYLDAKGLPFYPFGLEGIEAIELPSVVYYDRKLAMTIYGWKQIAAYGLLALIVMHAGAAIVYHSLMRNDGVLRSMLPRRWRESLPAVARAGAAAALLLAFIPATGLAQAPFDHGKYAAELAASLSKACPMASPADVAAHDACRQNIGQGAEASWRDYHILFGGQQPGRFWLKDKKTSVFRGDIYQDLYMSLFMYTGKFRVQKAPDGMTTVAVEAYFRNGLPPGHYPYPFWHNEKKWQAYEEANEIRLRMDAQGKVIFSYRGDVGSEDNRGPYAHVPRQTFMGGWMWRDDKDVAQPVVTLFTGMYSADNPTLGHLDQSYRKMAIAFRNADCTVCHQPEGHAKMNKLTLLQTPYHAASAIDAVLDEVKSGKMPVDDYNDPKPLPAKLRAELIEFGEEFKKQLERADAWEREHKRPKARKAPVAN